MSERTFREMEPTSERETHTCAPQPYLYFNPFIYCVLVPSVPAVCLGVVKVRADGG